MNMLRRQWQPAALAFILLSGGGQGSSFAGIIAIDGIYYVESGVTETVTAAFNQPNGGTTSAEYHGLLKLTVAGTGYALGDAPSDAFYILGDGGDQPEHTPCCYQIAFDTVPLVGAPTAPTDPARNVKEHIRFDVDGGTQVEPPYVPAYRSDHEYSIVVAVDVPTPTALHFGVSDGRFADNSGQYEIRLAELIPATIVPGDVTFDGFVGADDLTTLILNWNATDADLARGDITGDRFVGADDLSRIIDNWNTGALPVGAAALPEPTSMAGFMALLVAIGARRAPL